MVDILSSDQKERWNQKSRKDQIRKIREASHLEQTLQLTKTKEIGKEGFLRLGR